MHSTCPPKVIMRRHLHHRRPVHINLYNSKNYNHMEMICNSLEKRFGNRAQLAWGDGMLMNDCAITAFLQYSRVICKCSCCWPTCCFVDKVGNLITEAIGANACHEVVKLAKTVWIKLNFRVSMTIANEIYQIQHHNTSASSRGWAILASLLFLQKNIF